MVNMAAYHAAVLCWLYFAQLQETVAVNPDASLPQLHKQAVELGRVAQL